MENNEMMNYEDIEIVEDVAGEGTKMGTGVAMLLGAGLAFAVGAGVKLVKKGIAAYKAKKALREAESHDFVVGDDFEDVESK